MQCKTFISWECAILSQEHSSKLGGKMFEAAEKTRAKKKCLFTASSPHSHLHKSFCWDRLSCPDAGSRGALLGMMTNNVGTTGLGLWCSPGSETKWPGAISAFTMVWWFPGVFFSSRGWWHNLQEGKGSVSKIWLKNGSSFSHFEDKTMPAQHVSWGAVKSSGIFWPFRCILTF